MAKLVAAVATPHGPQATLHWSKYPDFEQRDRNHPQLLAEPPITFDDLVARAPADLHERLTEERWRQCYERAQAGLEAVKGVLTEAVPDVLVVIGDDQHEQLLDDNMPQFCIYWGDTVAAVRRERSEGRRRWMTSAEGLAPSRPSGEYPAAPELAKHAIKSLIRQGFDIATSNQLKPEVGLGHAFTAAYRLS